MNQAGLRHGRIIEKYFGLDPASAQAVLAELDSVSLKGGQWLFHQGDEGDALFFLVTGRLQVLAERQDGPTKFLGEIVPGDSVGEISLLTGERRTAGVRAIRDSRLVKIDRIRFEELCQRYPRLAIQLAGSVASVLHRRTTRSGVAARALNTIAIQPLASSERIVEFCKQLTLVLAQNGATLYLNPEGLGEHGAPVAMVSDEDVIDEPLAHWLHEQEISHRFVIYACSQKTTPWTEFALQQSDIIVYVAEASHDPFAAKAVCDAHPLARDHGARRLLVLLQAEASVAISGTAEWLKQHSVDMHLHVRADRPDDIARVARILAGTATGLVLAGGAARGFAHLGVYKAMVEAGIPIDWVGGTSIGAIMGAAIAMDWGPTQAVEKGRAAFVTSNPFGDVTLPLISLIRGQRMEGLLAKYLGVAIEDLPIPFFCVSCNVDDGSINQHEIGYLPDALRASAALPGILPPAVMDGRLVFDGAVLNNMPVDLMRSKLIGKVIAVDLASHKPYRVSYQRLPSPWLVLLGRWLPFTRKHRVPSLMTLMLKATEMGTLARMRELGAQADLLLSPQVRQFGMLNLKAYDRIVDAGYACAKVELLAWLARKRDA